jgi:IclR family KDG regulon transcriptional repressor
MRVSSGETIRQNLPPPASPTGSQMSSFQADPRYEVGPVARAAEVLAFVVVQPNSVSLTSVVEALDMPKTTVFRYLQTFAAAGLLHYHPATDRYGAGERFRAIAEQERFFTRLREAASAAIEHLARGFAETVNLGVLRNAEIVYVDIREAPRAHRFEARVGIGHPIHSTALGKAIVSGLPDSEVNRLIKTELMPRTTRTITDISSFRRQMREARRVGYAIDAGENEEGVFCVGVPIIDRAGRTIAAISLTAPHNRMPHLKDRAISSLREAAGRISASME